MIVDGVKLEALIDRYVNGKKAERNRAILKAYYLKGCTYEEIEELIKELVLVMEHRLFFCYAFFRKRGDHHGSDGSS